MKIASQIIVGAASFVLAWLLGSLFVTAFWQMGYHAKHLSPGKPLPAISGFFVDHQTLPLPLALLPWLWLVGGPVLSLHAMRNYWDASAFVLRFLAFLTCESLLFTVLLGSLFLPFAPYYFVLQTHEQGALETAASLFYWLVVAVILAGGGWRVVQLRRARESSDHREG